MVLQFFTSRTPAQNSKPAKTLPLYPLRNKPSEALNMWCTATIDERSVKRIEKLCPAHITHSRQHCMNNIVKPESDKNNAKQYCLNFEQYGQFNFNSTI